MTVSTTIAKSGPYAGAGTTGPFLVNFRFLQDNHLQVVKTNPDGIGADLSLTTDYTVSGAGNQTGSVTLTSPLDIGWSLTIIRSVPATQEADYVQNDAFPAESHERALDKLTMIAQQHFETLTRAVRAPIGDTAPSMFLPTVLDRSGKYLSFDDQGSPVATTFDVDAVINAAEEAVQAAADATESASESAASASDAAQSADSAEAYAALVAEQTSGAVPNVYRFSGTGVQTDFVLPVTPGSINNTQLYIDGVYQQKDTYFVVDSVIVFSFPPPVGTENIEIVVAPSVQIVTGNASNISITGEDSISRPLSSLANTTNPEFGAAMIGRASVSIGSVADLVSTPMASRRSDLIYVTTSYHDGWESSYSGPVGGGEFVWDASMSKSSHNGGTIISNTVPFTWADDGASFLNAVGETDPSGFGCFVRVNLGDTLSPQMFGVKGYGAADDRIAFQKGLDVLCAFPHNNVKVYDCLGADMHISAPGVGIPQSTNVEQVKICNGSFTALGVLADWSPDDAMFRFDRGYCHRLENFAFEGSLIANGIYHSCNRAWYDNIEIIHTRHTADGYGFKSGSDPDSFSPRLNRVSIFKWRGADPLKNDPAHRIGYGVILKTGDSRMVDCQVAWFGVGIQNDGPNNMFLNCHTFAGSNDITPTVEKPNYVMTSFNYTVVGCYIDNGPIEIHDTTGLIDGCSFVHNSGSNYAGYIKLVATGVNVGFPGLVIGTNRYNQVNWGNGVPDVFSFDETSGTFATNVRKDLYAGVTQDVETTYNPQILVKTQTGNSVQKLISRSNQARAEFVGSGTTSVVSVGANLNTFSAQVDGVEAFSATNTLSRVPNGFLHLGTGQVRVFAESGLLHLSDQTGNAFTVGSASFRPVTDNASSLGQGSNRFTQLFAANGTINTSDAREKTAVSVFTEDELNAAKQISSEIGTYKFLASIKEKGDDARTHIGMTVQRAIEIMEQNNLDPFSYGFICYDKWDDEYITVDPVYAEVEYENGKISRGDVIKPGYKKQTRKAGELYSFRYDQLTLFIMRGIDARLEAAGI